jgi:hypothetical protein
MPGLWLAIKILPGDDRHRICPIIWKHFRSWYCHEICTVILHLRGVDLGLLDTLAANGRLTLKFQQAEPLMAEGKFQDAIAVSRRTQSGGTR